MDSDLALIGTGIRLAGLLHLALLMGAVVWVGTPGRLAAIPMLYALTLAAAMLRPIVPAADMGWLNTVVWAVSLALPAATYLIVVELTDRAVPHLRHGYVLLVPLAALPVAELVGYLGTTDVCAPGTAVCLPADQIARLVNVLTGAPLLLLIVVLRGRRLEAIRDSGEPARFALLLSIVALQTFVLAMDLLMSARVLPEVRVATAAAVLEVGLLYLVGSALFRVDRDLLMASTEDTAAPASAIHGESAPAPAAAPAPALTAAEANLLARVDQLMRHEASYRQPGFNRRQLAEALDVPEHRVSRVVNVGRNQSVTAMINAYRIAEARARLVDSTESVTEIAFGVGFNSLATFNRAFKQATGMSPSTYRAHAAPSAVSANA